MPFSNTFLVEINECLRNGGFDRVIYSDNIEEASAIFGGIFGSILNKYAPVKVVQVRHNYVPWISLETKQLQAVRDKLKKEAIKDNCSEKFEAYKQIRNRIVNRLKSDKIDYYKTKFNQENASSSDLWKEVHNYLNRPKSVNSPNIIAHNGKICSAPRDIANAINAVFLDKVQRLKASTCNASDISPAVRLQKFFRQKR